MNPLDRLRALRDNLTSHGSIVFTRADLSELLGEAEPVSGTPDICAADLTVEQVGERLGRRPNTIRDWIRAGRLRAYLFNGREYRVTAHALAEFIEAEREGKREPKPQVGKAADLGQWRKLRNAA